MAYTNYPQNYQQSYQQNYYQPSLVNVNSEQEARDYLVANGTSVTFIDTNARKLYIKSRGFSSLDRPVFKRYDIVEIDEANNTTYAEKGEIEALRGEIEAIKSVLKRIGESSE